MQQYKFLVLGVVLCSGCAATQDLILHDKAKDYHTAKMMHFVPPQGKTLNTEYHIPAVTTAGSLAPSDVPPGLEDVLKG